MSVAMKHIFLLDRCRAGGLTQNNLLQTFKIKLQLKINPASVLISRFCCDSLLQKTSVLEKRVV